MQFKGELKDYILTLNNGCILNISTNINNLSMEELNSFKMAKNGLKIEIKQWREQRSLNSNAYFHLLVNKIAEVQNIGNDECKIKLNLEYGTPATDKDGNKVVIKLPSSVDVRQFYDYAKWIAEKEEKGLKLSYYLFYKQTHTLDTKEMSRLIDGTIYEAKQLGIETITETEKNNMLSLWQNN